MKVADSTRIDLGRKHRANAVGGRAGLGPARGGTACR